MVDIREEGTSEGGDGNEGGGGGGAGGAGGGGNGSVLEEMRRKPVDAVLTGLRVLTVAFGLLYAVPIFGEAAQSSAYAKTLTAAAATNGLRLWQRLGASFRFSREWAAAALAEDSAHYLFYSVVFLSLPPVTMPLLPPFLFALLHSASTILSWLRGGGMGESWLGRILSSFLAAYSQTILSVIATTEIFLMPLNIVLIFAGKGSLLFPFLYYRFLCMRYLSHRNPNTRVAFAQLRLAAEQAVNRASCPAFLHNIVYKAIGLISRLCPQAY